MAYFPESIMPKPVKIDLPNQSGAILAEDYNGHSDQIIDMEQFLGTGPASMADENRLLASSPDTVNVVGIARNLADTLNTFIDAGIQTSSGYIHSGEFVTFPENVQACFLTGTPGPTDTTISVTTTLGFPDTGVISILNDSNIINPNTVAGLTGAYTTETHAEWIYYSSKTSNAFLGCQRGFLGTVAGSHFGNISGTVTPPTNAVTTNLSLPILTNVQVFPYPGYRQRLVYSISQLDLSGTNVQIIRTIRTRPESFNLSAGKLGTSFAAITGAAKSVGILAVDASGDLILKSQDPAYSSIHQLTWAEASAFYNALSSFLKFKSDSQAVKLGTGVPVFQGKMSMQFSIAAATLNPLITYSTGSSIQDFQEAIAALVITQSSSGQIKLESRSNLDKSATAIKTVEPLLSQAIIQYRTFFVPSARSSVIRDDSNV